MFKIADADKPKALAALYNASQPLGMGFIHFTPEPMTEDEAAQLLADRGERPYFDYLKGRVMKLNFARDEIDTRLFDRDNGEGAGELALRNAGLVQ
ncbi:hypothetical protein [Paracoccus hibiscisoli]|uniref:Uncharacterized protein n=1 Tax=Paracoccus hibiscisoli TaxID=2023261 RepID=A0A4V5MTW3_9RHOB|nr:hypothetical protein [Paracoccus hibiscisoli]TJZ85798.1 hypothetical protein FA740_05205 [Paracoccus hibiscisoli]